MRPNLDATTDYSYKEINLFLNASTIPEFVKSAEYLTKQAADQLPDEAFADTYHRAFPINTAPDVYISNAFFMNKKAALEDLWETNYINTVESRINKAAELFNIKEDLAKYNANLMEKSAADYTENTLVSFDVAGTNYELFPYKTAEDLTTQAEVFSNNIKNYPFDWRNKIASEFVKQASELGIEELPDILCKYSGQFFPDLRDFQDILTRRMNKLAEDKQSKYKELVEKSANISSREEAMNICAEAYKIEKLAGVYDKPLLYREMGDIVDRTMTLSLDKIAEYLNSIKLGQEVYSIADLQKVSKDVYKQAFDCDIDPTKAAELKEVLPTMPLSDIHLFKELSGITPV